MFERRVDSLSVVNEMQLAGISYFDPFLKHFMRAALQSGGEVIASEDGSGAITGIAIYDGEERAGSIFTRSTEVFEKLRRTHGSAVWFSEIAMGVKKETYLIYVMNPSEGIPMQRFRHEVTLAASEDIRGITQTLKEVYGRTSEKWVRAAFLEQEKCFLVKDGETVTGVAWLSIANHSGRLHTLSVLPRYRRQGIGRDLLLARLMWLRAAGAELAISEIAESNTASRRIAEAAGMQAADEIYQYYEGTADGAA